MKKRYTTVAPKDTTAEQGICTVILYPRSWITAPLSLNADNAIIEPPAIEAGKVPLQLHPEDTSKQLEITPQESAAGPYSEVKFNFLSLVKVNDGTLSVVRTLSSEELVAIFEHKDGTKTIVGDTNRGMRVAFTLSENNVAGAVELRALLTFTSPEGARALLV